MALSMADSTLTYQELLRENASLKEQLAEREASAERGRRTDEQARLGERLRRVAAEAALRESEARYRTLADTMPQVVFIATASGFVEYVNRPGLEYMGLRLDEAIGFGWLEAIHPEDRQLVADRWLECLKIGKTYEFEHRPARRPVPLAAGPCRSHRRRNRRDRALDRHLHRHSRPQTG